MAARTSTRNSFMKLPSALMGRTSSQRPDDGAWLVGSRYEVLQPSYLYANPKLSGKEVYEVRTKDAVLLLQHETTSGIDVGFVLSPGENRVAGWMPLTAVRQQRLAGSWELRARYRVKHPATLRSEVALSSMFVAEVEPNQEVVILEIGVHVKPDSPTDARLRLKVSCCSGDPFVRLSQVTSPSPSGFHDGGDLIGWMSAETVAGDQLLDPVNLLGMDAVKLHRNSVQNNLPASGAMKRISRASQQGGAQIGNPMNAIPWQVGGQYRVLERLPLREKKELSSRKVTQLPVGAIVTISEIHMMECAHLGWCPCAYVSSVYNNDMQKSQRGWVRCAGKDGRNLIDERDQLEFEKVNAKIRTSQFEQSQMRGKKVQISAHPPQQREIADRHSARDRDENDSDWSEDSEGEYYESEESESEEGESAYDDDEELPAKATAPDLKSAIDSAEKLPVASAIKDTSGASAANLHGAMAEAEAENRMRDREFAKKLQAMEIGAKEERLVDDKTIITEERFCGCGDCGIRAR